MNEKINNYFGNTFERVFVAFLAIATGVTLIYLAIEGPLFLQNIRYKAAAVISNQLVAQDFINMFVLSPLLFAGGISLFLKKRISPYLLIMTPLYLIYFALSYTIGWEWSSAEYTGNSEAYTFYFLFIIVSAVIILLYSFSIFPENIKSSFNKKGLIIYSILFSVFLLMFASMWIREVREVALTGTARGYDISPTTFWVVRIFDLGFSIPLGLLSVYLLWVRPNTTFTVQFMFYGFFLTMIIAVNAMSFVMFFKNDPTFMLRDMLVFVALALIICIGFVYVIRNYDTKQKLPETLSAKITE